MLTAFRGARGSRGLCKWNLPGCIRSRVRRKSPRADHLPQAPHGFRGDWKKRTVLSSLTSPATTFLCRKCSLTGREVRRRTGSLVMGPADVRMRSPHSPAGSIDSAVQLESSSPKRQRQCRGCDRSLRPISGRGRYPPKQQRFFNPVRRLSSLRVCPRLSSGLNASCSAFSNASTQFWGRLAGSGPVQLLLYPPPAICQWLLTTCSSESVHRNC
jgi:hypothetical protein